LLLHFYIKCYEINQLNEIYNIVGDPGIQGEYRCASWVYVLLSLHRFIALLLHWTINIQTVMMEIGPTTTQRNNKLKIWIWQQYKYIKHRRRNALSC